MRMFLVLCTLVCFLAGTTLHAQEISLEAVSRPSSRIVESAVAASSVLGRQFNSAPQRQRRGGRIWGGVGLLAVGGSLLFLKDLFVEEVPEDHQTNVNTGLVLGAAGLMAVGGIMIATADTQSRIPRVHGGQRRRVFGIAPTRGGGAVVQHIAW